MGRGDVHDAAIMAGNTVLTPHRLVGPDGHRRQAKVLATIAGTTSGGWERRSIGPRARSARRRLDRRCPRPGPVYPKVARRGTVGDGRDLLLGGSHVLLAMREMLPRW